MNFRIYRDIPIEKMQKDNMEPQNSMGVKLNVSMFMR